MSLDSQLVEDYQALASAGSSSAIDIEERKQQILQSILVQLSKDTPLPFYQPQIENKPSKLDERKTCREYAYYLLLCFGVLEDLANSYFMGSALFLLLVPNIAMSMLFIASLIYAVIEGTLFYMFDSYELRMAVGVDDTQADLSVLLNVYEEQIKLASALNRHLSTMSTLTLSDEDYLLYVTFLRLVNRDLSHKLEQIQSKQESTAQWFFRWAVCLFGAISSLAGSYFMVTTLMSLMCLAMLTTPVGLVITIGTMILGLAFHYFMDSTSLTRVVNPHHEKLEFIKQELSLFSQTYLNKEDFLLEQRAQYKPSLSKQSLFKPQSAANSENLECVLPIASTQI